MVGKERLELSEHCYCRILSPLCLPISPRGPNVFINFLYKLNQSSTLKLDWVGFVTWFFFNSVQYLFHVNNLSRNHKTLQSCVAPSVSPGSISILIAKQSSLQSFVGSFRSPFKVGPENLSNFQSFPRGRSTPFKYGSHSFSLYCLIQTVSLIENILSF